MIKSERKKNRRATLRIMQGQALKLTRREKKRKKKKWTLVQNLISIGHTLRRIKRAGVPTRVHVIYMWNPPFNIKKIINGKIINIP